jgi:hypothetical protein
MSGNKVENSLLCYLPVKHCFFKYGYDILNKHEVDNMDYEWKKIEEHGQPAIGFIEVYETIIECRAKVLTIINYFPQLPSSGYEQQATVTFYHEGAKETITDGLSHSIKDDLCEIIKNNEEKMYPQKTEKKIKHTQMQIYLVDKMPKLNYFSHGDYAGFD